MPCGPGGPAGSRPSVQRRRQHGRSPDSRHSHLQALHKEHHDNLSSSSSTATGAVARRPPAGHSFPGTFRRIAAWTRAHPPQPIQRNRHSASGSSRSPPSPCSSTSTGAFSEGRRKSMGGPRRGWSKPCGPRRAGPRHHLAQHAQPQAENVRRKDAPPFPPARPGASSPRPGRRAGRVDPLRPARDKAGGRYRLSPLVHDEVRPFKERRVGQTSRLFLRGVNPSARTQRAGSFPSSRIASPTPP